MPRWLRVIRGMIGTRMTFSVGVVGSVVGLMAWLTRAAGAGLVLFALLSINGIGAWSMADAIVNLVILIAMGAGSAISILLLARRARTGATLMPGAETLSLGEATLQPDHFGGARSSRGSADERVR